MPTTDILTFLDNYLNTYLADLQHLVSLDSYSYEPDDVNQVVDWLEIRLHGLGFTVERFPHDGAGDDLLARRSGKGTKRITLLGHSDTVFPRGTTAQRPMRTEGDKILGPGTCDMKGGCLVGIYAVMALDALGFDDYGEIKFLIVSDEEIDERHAIPLIREVSRESDVVLTLEAARENGDIVVARKGVRSFQVEAFGRAAHSGVEPEKGRSAILALAHHIIALENLNNPAQGISVNVGKVEGGQLRNIVPDYARIGFEMRAFTRADLEQMTQTIENLFQQSAVPDVTFNLTWIETSPPMPRTPQIAALEEITSKIGHELGFEVHGAATGGAADAAFAADEGIPALDGLGPIGGLDHSPNEYILKSSIVPRTALLARLMMAIAENEQ